MFGRILVSLIIAALAWHFAGDVRWLLEHGAPAVGWLILSLVPKDIDNKDAEFYLNFALACLFFWIALKGARLATGFLLPHSQRFGTTKLVRRAQGVFAELFILGVFFVIGYVLLSWTGAVDRIGAERACEVLSSSDRATLEQQRCVDDVLNLILAMRKEGRLTYHWALLKLAYGYVWKELWLTAVVLYLLFHWVMFKGPMERVYRAVLRFFEIGRFGIGGSGRFAGLVEEWAHRYRPGQGSLFLGRSLYNRFLNIGIRDDRMMLTIGGSRAGKGTTVIIPNLLQWEGSAIVIDPKGTNAAVTAQRRRDMGHDVRVIDPFGVLGGETDGFDPLSALNIDSPTIREDVAVLADALVVPEPDAKNAAHWESGARTILSGLIAHLISGKWTSLAPTLPMLRDMMALGQEEMVRLWVDMKHNRAAGDLARDAGTRVTRGMDTDEITNILSNVDKHTEWLSSPALRAALIRPSFQFSDLKKKPTTVYLVVPPRFLDIHRRFLRLFINLALLEMSVGHKSKIPVLMILDEFLALGRMDEVSRAFRLLAGYNLVIWPFIQDWAEMKRLYGGSVHAFITNSRAVQVFGLSDEESLRLVSSKVGERATQWVRSVHDTHRSVPLRTPTEVSIEINIENNLQYILRNGKAPIIAEKVRYFEGQWADLPGWLARRIWPFKGLYGNDPDYS